MNSYHLDHLQYLETEAIHVLREVAAEFERPAILFSGGKDSICILRLAEKAFRPSDIPMVFLKLEAFIKGENNLFVWKVLMDVKN